MALVRVVLIAFGTIWLSSLAALRLASIELLDDADRILGSFAGGTAGVVILIVLFFVPKRLKLHSVSHEDIAARPRRSR